MPDPIAITIARADAQKLGSGAACLTEAKRQAKQQAEEAGVKLATTEPEVHWSGEAGKSDLVFSFALQGGTTMKQQALPIPSYKMADLPLASANPQSIVIITDNPQGQARSDGVNWLSEVDGSSLGPGNGSS